MDKQTIYKIIYTAISLVSMILITQILLRQAKLTQQKLKIQKSRYFMLRKVIRVFAVIILAILLIVIWGLDMKNLWVTLTSILGLIAIAFFAIWSLIGNILAGMIIFFTSPFKVNDTIEVLPDGIKGKVLAINAFYTLLGDEKGNYINVPNSLFFQKYIKLIKNKKAIVEIKDEIAEEIKKTKGKTKKHNQDSED